MTMTHPIYYTPTIYLEIGSEWIVTVLLSNLITIFLYLNKSCNNGILEKKTRRNNIFMPISNEVNILFFVFFKSFLRLYS